MKYSFNPKELSNWKARITERLVRCYIEDVVIPTLRKQGWSEVIFTPFAWCGTEPEEEFEWEQKFFIANGLFPTKEFLRTFIKLTRLLETVPDGFLLKVRKTERTKPLKGALKEFGLENVQSFGIRGEYWFIRSEHNENEQLPIVNGEIEVIEVKSGKSVLAPSQKRSYRKILQEGYVLRFFHVNIISFEKNEFEIEEKLLTSPDDLKTFPLKEK